MKIKPLTLILTLVLASLVILLVNFVYFSPFNACSACAFLETEYKEKKFADILPFRLLCDENRNIVPIVALTAFLSTQDQVERYNNYIINGINVIGYTSYKSFPKPISDGTIDNQTLNDKFEYTKKIKNWVCCFKNPRDYTFTEHNNLLEMSESDFIDAVEIVNTPKKYDFIYSCLRDPGDNCPLNGWNAINRNFDLAMKCFPIMINDFNLKILVIGRLNCGLEEIYGKNIEVIDFLPYNEFQTKLKESKYLFVPNIYDASPRVITEALVNDIPVLMNKNIICGSKYINDNTGEFFTDQYDINYHLKRLLQRTMHPRDWWKANYSRQISGIKFRNFLYKSFPYLPQLKKAQQIVFH